MSWLIWGVEVHGLLEKQLDIDLYASVSYVENDPLASLSPIVFPKFVQTLFKSLNLFVFTLNSSKPIHPLIKCVRLVRNVFKSVQFSVLSLNSLKFVQITS